MNIEYNTHAIRLLCCIYFLFQNIKFIYSAESNEARMRIVLVFSQDDIFYCCPFPDPLFKIQLLVCCNFYSRNSLQLTGLQKAKYSTCTCGKFLEQFTLYTYTWIWKKNLVYEVIWKLFFCRLLFFAGKNLIFSGYFCVYLICLSVRCIKRYGWNETHFYFSWSCNKTTF